MIRRSPLQETPAGENDTQESFARDSCGREEIAGQARNDKKIIYTDWFRVLVYSMFYWALEIALLYKIFLNNLSFKKIKELLNMKKFILLNLVFVFVSSLSNAFADGIYKRVKFKKGESSASYENSVVRGDRDIYVLGAKKYQVMTVSISSLEDNAVFQIVDKRTGRMLYGAADGDDATSWDGELPSTGDYEIIVGGTRGNASYTLTVYIE